MKNWLDNYNDSKTSAPERLKQLMQNVEVTPHYQMGGNIYPVNYVPGYHSAERYVENKIGNNFSNLTGDNLGFKDGGVIQDDMGQWNHPGEVTEINSNEITMKPDPRTGKPLTKPLLGISDTGDVKLMRPGGKYKFDGKKVTEYPIAQNGFVDKLKADSKARKEKNVKLRELPRTAVNDVIPSASKKEAKADLAREKDIRYAKEVKRKFDALPKEEQERILYNQYGEEHGTISPHTPQSTSSRAWEIATHPMTAFGYVARNENLPEHFSRGEINAHESAVDMINPFFYVNQAGEFTKNLSEGNFTDAGLNALSFIPATAEFAPELRTLGKEVKTGLKEYGNVLKDLPKAKSFKEAAGRFAGFPVEGALPRLSPEELKTFRQVQEVGRMKATGKPISQQYQYALEQGLPEEHLQKVFGKTRAEIESAIAPAQQDEAYRLANPASGRINLQRPPRPSAGAAQQADRDRLRAMMRGWDEDVNASQLTAEPIAPIEQLPSSGFDSPSFQSRIAAIRAENDANIARNVNTNLDDLFAELDAGTHSSQTNRLRNENMMRSLYTDALTEFNPNKVQDAVSQGLRQGIAPLENLAGDARNKFMNYVQEYPYYEGPVMENVPHLTLRSSGSLKNVSNQVSGASTAGMNTGDIFTGSLNTSHSSYLPQLKQVFKYEQGAPQFFGYKPMNQMGFLSEFDYDPTDISKYLNSEIDEQIRRGVIPSNIQRPYAKGNQVLLPHYGIKQFREGGNIRQEQKGLVNLDQLTNFTNYNNQQPGGWLNKYNY